MPLDLVVLELSNLPDRTLEVVAGHAGPLSLSLLRGSARGYHGSVGLSPGPRLLLWWAEAGPLQERLHEVANVNPIALLASSQKVLKVGRHGQFLDTEALWLWLARPHNLGKSLDKSSKLEKLLCQAARNGDAAACHLLLAAGGQPLAQNGDAAMLSAVLHGRVAAARSLIQARVDPEAGQGQWRPLEAAAARGTPELVTLLLEARADPNGKSVQYVSHGDDGLSGEVVEESTPLLSACDRCRPLVFGLLLEARADPDIECVHGLTETGMRSTRDTLAWMLDIGDSRQFRSFGGTSGHPTEALQAMMDMLEQ